MRIVLDELSLLDDLADFLRRCGYEPRQMGPRSLEAVAADSGAPESLSAVQIDGYLRTWMLMHPGATAELVSVTARSDAA